MNDKQNDKLGQSIVNELASELLLEHRRSRRWGIFFKAVFAFYILAVFIIYLGSVSDDGKFYSGKHTALIDIDGVIAADTDTNADFVVASLRQAFKDSSTKGVILRINSPGGSPVQAGYINDEIRRLKGEHPEIPVYAVISDICASGGYYIAVAADKIYADKASIVGSIGVAMAGFGFTGAIEKLGIERRFLHAGKNKAFMDPFQPLKSDEVEHAQALLDEIHRQFVSVVKNGRGDKLVDDGILFSGLIWSGEESVKLGLVDGLASASQVAREIIGAEDIVDFTRHENYLDRFAKQMGAGLFRSLNNRSFF